MKVTIIGATGSLGKAATQNLLAETDAELTLFARSADRLPDNPRVTKVAASVSDRAALETALTGSDLVFVALSGDLPSMVQSIIQAMYAVGVKRLVFITSYGIYAEIDGGPSTVPAVLRPYRQAADLIEASDLDYTILRPGWFDNSSDTSYQLIPKGETIYGNDISRKAIASFVADVAKDSSQHIGGNYGMVR